MELQNPTRQPDSDYIAWNEKNQWETIENKNIGEAETDL